MMKKITQNVSEIVAGVVAGNASFRAWVNEEQDAVFGTEDVAVMYYDADARFAESEENADVARAVIEKLNAEGYGTEWNGDPLYVIVVKDRDMAEEALDCMAESGGGE